MRDPPSLQSTGIFACSTTALRRAAPPRGIIASRLLPDRISSTATSFSGRSMMIHAPAGTPFCSAASRSPVPITCCVRPHSGAPRKMQRLPDLKQSAIDSTVISGLSSDTTPITPIGTRTRLSCNPSGRSDRDVTAPTGSGRSAIIRRRSTISLISSGVMRRRATAAFIRSFYDIGLEGLSNCIHILLVRRKNFLFISSQSIRHSPQGFLFDRA